MAHLAPAVADISQRFTKVITCFFFNHIPTGSTCHTRSGQYTQARRENMPTELKSETARANGAKSHGPITTEGKEKSSKNALKHGMTSRNIYILECESA